MRENGLVTRIRARHTRPPHPTSRREPPRRHVAGESLRARRIRRDTPRSEVIRVSDDQYFPHDEHDERAEHDDLRHDAPAPDESVEQALRVGLEDFDLSDEDRALLSGEVDEDSGYLSLIHI